MTVETSGPWRWIELSVVLAVHDRQIGEHGGMDGIRDLGAVESALSRPVYLAADGKPDAAELAAAHLYSLAWLIISGFQSDSFFSCFFSLLLGKFFGSKKVSYKHTMAAVWVPELDT